SKVTGGTIRYVSQGGSALLYIMDDSRRADIPTKAKEVIAELDGIEKIVTPEQYNEYRIGHHQHDPRSPDLILFAKICFHYADPLAGALRFVDEPERKGSHGHDAAIPILRASFIAWGAGIKPGVEIGEIDTSDVAPTIARIMDLPFPSAD